VTCDRAPVYAESHDGVWRFEGGALRSATATVEPFAIDYFERWTSARWMPGGQLVLTFESGQPWSDQGSYGSRYGGIEVLALTALDTWTVVSLEYDWRQHDETFVPLDVAWHPRGVLAWLHGNYLYAQRLVVPRRVEAVDAPDVWYRDSDAGLVWWYERHGAWRRLSLDEDGLFLTAIDPDGADVFDLEGDRLSRDGGEWVSAGREPLSK
jgi:hypothetical protein